MDDTLFLDGTCGLCSRSGAFLDKRLARPLKILELQSEDGQRIKSDHFITADSIVLLRNECTYIRSAAAIRCLLYMRWHWRWMFPLTWLIPLPIRDLVYHFVAKLRHRIS